MDTAPVTQNVYYSDTFRALYDFFYYYYSTTGEGPVQIFDSFTFGEMTIATLVAMMVALFCLKWLWEVLR